MATAHKRIYPQPSSAPCEAASSESILWGLGKATKRGTKKCPHCGYTNGTKSYTCKNARCSRTLKATDKHKVHIDAVKLVTATTRRIYSVRARERASAAPDQRGFVQLPRALCDTLSEVALCFVDNCERSYSILKCHERADDDEEGVRAPTSALNFCAHIDAAARSLSVAHALDFKHDLITNLKVCDDVKKKLCALATSSAGALVQRVARHVMAVKCFVDSAHPLGYLHFALHFSELKRGAAHGGEEIERFHCECGLGGKCLHYYACICAFASDAKLGHEYSTFAQREFDSMIAYDVSALLDEGTDSAYPVEAIRIEILRPDLLGLPQLSKASSKRLSKCSALGPAAARGGKKAHVKILSDNLVKHAVLSVENRRKFQRHSNLLRTERSGVQEMLSYQDWMTSVIERLNSACSRQSSTSPAHILNDTTQEVTMDFHIPEKFFQQFKAHLFSHTTCRHQTHEEPSAMGTNAETSAARQHAATSTRRFAINDGAQLEQLFSSTNIKFAACQLLLSERSPFRISWTGSAYRLSNFGTLQFIFTKRRYDEYVSCALAH